ncbi:MAG: VTT domain-containing protein [Myxococcales bacterium]|nr:VTT domain-containing protein [Myxococcales bacterium]
MSALLFLFVAAWWIGWKTGLADKIYAEDMRLTVLDAGAWGFLLFVALFCAGLFIQIPGLVFVTGAVLIYGYWLGMLVSFGGGLAAISVSFVVARVVGGDPLASLKHPRVKGVLARLQNKPIRTMGFLRIFMQISPPLNVALALSGVRYRDYLAAALLAMWVPIIVMASAVHVFVG